MKKIILLLWAILACNIIANADPAMPGFTKFKQSDGSTISVEAVGDEFFSYFRTLDGLAIVRNSKGDWVYATIEKVTDITAHDPDNRDTQEIAFIEAEKESLKESAHIDANSRELIKKVNSVRKGKAVPNAGTVKLPIILVEYADIKMKHSYQEIKDHYTSGARSVVQYFKDQSNGKFAPQFDVFGIYTLSNNREYYGANGSDKIGYSSDKDLHLRDMVTEAIQLAQNEGKIKWSDYDNNNDNECDGVFIIYAGVGESEATSTHPESIWPCKGYLSSKALFFDNIKIDLFTVNNEIKGTTDNDTKLKGIGTFVHEFGHALGLPDFYTSNDYYGMGRWSIMSYGGYNGDGYIPVGYNGYEKNFMGWIPLIEPEPNKAYTLQTMNQGSETTDQAIKIVSDLNSNEYYIIESRKKQGWDEDIRDEGLLITHVNYLPSRWSSNSVNSNPIQLMTVATANNLENTVNSIHKEKGSLWGNGKSDFTDTSTPAAKLYMTSTGSITGEAGYLGKPVTEIKRNADGTVSLWFMKGMVNRAPQMRPANHATIDLTEFKAEWTYPGDENLVNSYTLLVERKNYYKLIDADFSKGLPKDWTTSSTGTYQDGEYLRLGTNKGNGFMNSPIIDINNKDNLATIVIKAKPFENDLNVNMRVTLLDSEGNAKSLKDIVLDNDEQEYNIVLTGAGAGSQFRIESTDVKKRVMLKEVKIYSGEGDTRLFTGITNKSHTVKDLLPEEEYGYKVKAIFTDGRESAWSNMEYVKLEAQLKFDIDFSYRSRFDVKTHQNSYKNTLAIAAGTESADYIIYRTPNSLNHSSEFDSTPVEVASLRVTLSPTGPGQYAIYYNEPMDEREEYRFDNERLSFGGVLHGHPDELINIYDYFTEEVIANENKRAASYTYSISKYEPKFKVWSTPKDFATVPVYSGELSTPKYSPEYTIADLSKDNNRSLPVTDKATVSIMDYQNDDISASDMRKVNYRFYKGNEIVFKGTTTATISIPENAGDYTGEFCVTSPWGENTYGTAKVNVASIDVDVECPEFGWIYFGTDFNKRAYITDMVIKPQIVADNKPYVYYYNVWRGDEDAESLVRLNELSEMSVNGWTTNYAAIKNNYPIGNSTTDKLEVVDIYIDDAIHRGQTLINSGIVRMYYTPTGNSGKHMPSQKIYIIEKSILLEIYDDGMINGACDVNNDGCLDVTDVSELINQITGINSSPFNTKKGDIDNNGTLDVTDVTLLINKIIK